MDEKDNNLLILSADIVCAFVSNNSLAKDEVSVLIGSIHSTLEGLMRGRHPDAHSAPAVNPKKSVFDDYIVCLEDGKKFKSMKRYLARVYDLTPEQYREKWQLPADYPMIAPNYSAARSQMAKNFGLGRKSNANN